MEFFHHRTTERYVAALLDVFDDIYVQKTLSDDKVVNQKIDMNFSSRDRAFVLSKSDREQMLNGNHNILPRGCISMVDMMPDESRKLSSLNTIFEEKNGNKLNYTYNSTPWDFNFSVVFMTQTLSDATMIYEQILPHFRPTYPMKVFEVPFQKTATTVRLIMNSITVDIPEDLGDDEERLITVELNILLKGNIYPPIQETGIIERVEMWYDSIESTEQYKDTKISFDVLDGINQKQTHEEVPQESTLDVPVITSINADGTDAIFGQPKDLVVMFNDVRDGDTDISQQGFKFFWSADYGVLSGNGPRVTLNNSPVGNTEISVIVQDPDGNISEPFTTTIITKVQ